MIIIEFINLKESRIQLQIYFSEGKFQSNAITTDCPQFLVSSAAHCCVAAAWSGDAAATASAGQVLHTAEQGGRGRPCRHMMDVTGDEISCACLPMSARNLQVERLSNEINLKDIIQKEQVGLRKAFKQEKADDSNIMHNS